MVKFILVEETNEVAVYWYFPEGNKNEAHGVVTLFKRTGAVEITQLAPKDFSHRVTVEDLKALRDSENDMRREAGEPELTEDEWSTPTEGFICTFYADHVINKVRASFERGVVLKSGGAAWY